MKKGHKVASRWVIAQHYASSWLILDLASIMPFETVDVVIELQGGTSGENKQLKSVRFIRMLRLMKLLRVLRGMRIFSRWEARLALNYAVLSLQKYFLTLLLAAHWLGCTLFLLHSMLEPDCEMDVIHQDSPHSGDCTFLYHYQDGALVHAGARQKYELAMYFATGELMGTPFGDLVPVRSEERVFFIFCHLVAGFVNAYLLGGVVSAIAALNVRNQSFHQSMDTLNHFMKEKRLTATNPRLCERLRSYYIFKHGEGGDGDGWKDIMSRTSKEMQAEVVQEVNAKWFKRLPFFHGVDSFDGTAWEVDDDFKLELTLVMTIEMVAPLEAVFKEDSPIDKLYIIQQGLVGCKSRVLHPGQPFGEDVLIHYMPHAVDLDEHFLKNGHRYSAKPLNRGYRATALNNLVVMVFPGETINELLNRPRYEYVKEQVNKKMFKWQMRHVLVKLMIKIKEAVAAETFADGMQILVEEFGAQQISNLPDVVFHFMRLREDEGDEEVKVVRLFRKMMNRNKFGRCIDTLMGKTRRLAVLRGIRKDMDGFLETVGAQQHTKTILAQGITMRTIHEFSTAELATAGLPLVLAKRVCQAAAELPEPEGSPDWYQPVARSSTTTRPRSSTGPGGSGGDGTPGAPSTPGGGGAGGAADGAGGGGDDGRDTEEALLLNPETLAELYAADRKKGPNLGSMLMNAGTPKSRRGGSRSSSPAPW
jgi:CRP-like cAMP-binding protein